MTRKARKHQGEESVTRTDTPGSIPSTLDPDLSQETDDLEEELREHAAERHMPPLDEPRDEDPYEIQTAAESLPADMPVDRADRTDDREERPPARSLRGDPLADRDLDEEMADDGDLSDLTDGRVTDRGRR